MKPAIDSAASSGHGRVNGIAGMDFCAAGSLLLSLFSSSSFLCLLFFFFFFSVCVQAIRGFVIRSRGV